MKRTDPRVAADRLDWHRDAACRGELAAAFYPPLKAESKSERLSRERTAKSVCGSCSVRLACLEHAIDHDERYGIWGGLTDVERRHLPRSA